MATYEYQRQHQQVQHPYQQQPITQTSRQAVKFLTASTLGTALLGLSGLTLTGTVIALIVATPLLVLFSPVLVPAAITTCLLAAGFVLSGACGVAALTALSWLFRYATGRHPLGSQQLDYAGSKLTSAAREVTEKAKGNIQYVTHKVQDAAHNVTGQAQS